jgi:hypothetical protein
VLATSIVGPPLVSTISEKQLFIGRYCSIVHCHSFDSSSSGFAPFERIREKSRVKKLAVCHHGVEQWCLMAVAPTSISPIMLSTHGQVCFTIGTKERIIVRRPVSQSRYGISCDRLGTLES